MGFLYHLRAHRFIGLAKKGPIIHTRCRETLFLFFPGNTEVLNENQYNLEKKSTEGMDQLKKEINELQSEVASLQHVVEVRENKLLQLSKQNVDLQETANILRGLVLKKLYMKYTKCKVWLIPCLVPKN